MAEQKRIAIIGGGIAGLAAGIYAQQHGFRTTIYEKNDVPGGACMSWVRGRLPVEGTLRFLLGTQEGTPLFDCWQEVGALRNALFVTPDSLFTAEESDTTVSFCQDVEAFYRQAQALSPDDAPQIRHFCDVVHMLQYRKIPVSEPANLTGPLALLHTATATEREKLLRRLHAVSLESFARQLTHPALRCAFREVLPQQATLALLAQYYADFATGNLAVPVGGSRRMIQGMTDEYLRNDGQLKLDTPVQEIVTANGAARGVILADGERRLTHWVVAACDPAYTCRVLLQDRYALEKKLQQRFCEPEVYPTCSLVRFFFSAPADSLPLTRTLSFPTDVIPAGDVGTDRLAVTQFSDDPTFVKNGRAAFAVDMRMFGRRTYQYWEALTVQEEACRRETTRLTAAVQQALEKRFPGMAGKLRLLGCHTPVTYAQRLNAYQGSCMAFVPTPQAKMMTFTGRLPGLSRLLLAGQWLGETAGMHTALLQGKYAIQRICHDERLSW